MILHDSIVFKLCVLKKIPTKKGDLQRTMRVLRMVISPIESAKARNSILLLAKRENVDNPWGGEQELATLEGVT